MTPIELFPRTQSTDRQHTYNIGTETERRAYFMAAVNCTCGILEGRGRQCQHAVYSRYGQIYDPDPDVSVYDFSFENCEQRGLYANCLWIIHGLNYDNIL